MKTISKAKLVKSGEGFTLIELLVVIAVIGLLASVVLVALNSSRAKARDARKKADFAQISKALQIYYLKYDAMPINRNPGYGYPDTSPNFLQELVDDGILAKNPKAPDSESIYWYYDYGQGNSAGALLQTMLEASPPSTTGDPPSCRPWAAGINWCDATSSRQYCMCNTY